MIKVEASAKISCGVGKLERNEQHIIQFPRMLSKAGPLHRLDADDGFHALE
jgi:hypothetical protein